MIELEELYATPSTAGTSPAERAILRAAIELFGARGYGATSVRQIAAAAGVTPPLIAYHYESKDGLFRACHEVVVTSIGTRLRRAVAESTSLPDLVRALARTHLDFPEQHPAALRLLLTVFYGPEAMNPPLQEIGVWAGLLEETEARFREAIERGEFKPRPGTNSIQLTRLLFRLMQVAVFERYEANCCPMNEDIDPEFLAATGDPVEEIHDQFFFGAGDLSGPDHQKLEDTR